VDHIANRAKCRYSKN